VSSYSSPVGEGVIVWTDKPWIVPSAIIRTATAVVIAIIILMTEYYTGVALVLIAELPIYVWTLLVFVFVWALCLLDLLFFWMSNTYILRRNGLETRRGIVRLHSFCVTPGGFGDLAVYQSVGGRIFGYGNLTVNSQGARETKLMLVKMPFAVADTIREIMGKPLVRVGGCD
jgi:hypothetical protein